MTHSWARCRAFDAHLYCVHSPRDQDIRALAMFIATPASRRRTCAARPRISRSTRGPTSPSWWLHHRGAVRLLATSIRAGERGHRTPETVCMKPGSGSPLSLFGSGGEPIESSETRTSSVVPRRRRAQDASANDYIAGFTRAPSGSSPCSTYRHKAMSSLRASATIPIRRSRRPPPPNRR